LVRRRASDVGVRIAKLVDPGREVVLAAHGFDNFKDRERIP
jgi:hypothetical protein